MTPDHRAIRRLAAIVALLAAACATGSRRGSHGALAPPKDRVALGLVFGQDRSAIARALDVDGIPHQAPADDPDVLLAARCSGAYEVAPLRILFCPEGLYAAQLEVPAAEERALVSAVARGLGAPVRRGDGRSQDGLPGVLAAWEPAGWSIGVSRHAPPDGAAVAVLHVQYDGAAPPVAAGIPLGRLRVDVEHLLDRQGATVVQRDVASTTYLGCPGGAPDALSCIVLFRGGRAAAVTEVHVTPAEDREALAAWRERADRLEAEIGRAPARVCAEAGPDRIAGDCTATWATDRLVVLVGAHRNAGARHRGTISVYTGFTYPPLAAGEDDTDADPAAP
jgi:hypothetical protein